MKYAMVVLMLVGMVGCRESTPPPKLEPATTATGLVTLSGGGGCYTEPKFTSYRRERNAVDQEYTKIVDIMLAYGDPELARRVQKHVSNVATHMRKAADIEDDLGIE